MGDAGAKKAHTWSFEVQKSGAEHFVTFLYNEKHLNDDYSISKNNFYRALHIEYQPRYHWNHPPGGVLSLLLKCKFIKKQSVKQDINILHFDAHKLKPVIKKLNNSAKSGVPQPLDERVTHPVETYVVSHQTAFRPKQQRKAGLSARKCDFCQVTFSSQASCDAHKGTEIHRLREVYRNNRKSLYASKEVCVYASKNSKGMEKCVARPGQKGTMKLYIGNSSRRKKFIEDVIRLVDLPEVQIRHSEVPLTVLPDAEIPLLLDYKFVSFGSYLYPLVLKVRKKSAEDCSYVLKEIVFSCQSEVVDDLQPVSKYKQVLPSKFKISEGPIVAGLAPPPVRTGLSHERKLLPSLIPVDLQTLLNHELKTYPTISKNLQSKLKELKGLLGLDEKMETVSRCALQPETYCKLFSTLLHIEEHQMKIDIRSYDCDGIVLKKLKGSPLLAMNVPGLAEKRPSVLKGDSIHVLCEGDTQKVQYEGFVHNIHETELHLGFSESFCDAYTQGMKLHVQFKFSRYPLKVEHRALNILEKVDGGKLMLPKERKGITKSAITIKLWRNRDVENNEQQKIAVMNIVNSTAYPAPYIVFGPPGTGKTVTIVESIVQLWDLHKTDKKKHILVCAPSNAAADVLAVRLLKYIPQSTLLRMYASSCSYDAVPELLRKCSNFDERGLCFYPTKEAVMNFPIIVVTLVTAAKLVGAGIPAGHFSHVFVDECGHAVEPEVLVPVAGLLICDKRQATVKGQLVLAGDPKQLGPILRSPLAIRLGLGMSLLERLMEDEQLYKRHADTQQYDPTVLTKLVKNFRSHESILAVSNRLFYDGELQVCGGPEISLACSWEELPKSNFPVIFHGIVGQDEREANSPSFFNVMEIDVVLSYLDNLFEDRLKGRKIRQNEVGIVSPYRKQVDKIKRALMKRNWSDVSVGSVEEFQGQERLVIIISTVRSSHKFVPDDYKFQLGFLKNPKRLNVALTRAKALLVVVGNPNILQCDIHWRTFITYCMANGAYRGVKFTQVTNEEDSVVNSLVNGVAHLCLNPEEASMRDDGPNWRGEI